VRGDERPLRGRRNLSEGRMNPDVRDADLIGAAQRVEHYEVAGYRTVHSLAHRLGEHQTGEILQPPQTLNEEGEANKKLAPLAESQAMSLLVRTPD
jgi:ferritin-like metal-binding protein YciE